MRAVTYIVLVPMVYAAFAVFFAGTGVRLVKLFGGPWRSGALRIYPASAHPWLRAVQDTFLLPGVRRHDPVLWVFLMVFHACLFLLLLGHLELLERFAILQVVPHEIFLGKGLVGVALVVSLLHFLFRRFSSPVRDLSVPEDYYLLILLFLIAIFGSEMDWARRWYGYGEMDPGDYRAYLTGLLTLKTRSAPRADRVGSFVHAGPACVLRQRIPDVFFPSARSCIPSWPCP